MKPLITATREDALWMGLPRSRVMTQRWTRLWIDFFGLIDRSLEQDLFAVGGAIRVELDDRFRDPLQL